jgi:CRP-like cAMP-binding protein
MAEERVAADAVLFRREDQVHSHYLVVAGCISLDRATFAGSRLVLERAEAGMIVAEASIFAVRYHCDASAIADSKVRKLNIADLRQRLKTDAALSMLLSQHLAHQAQASRFRAEI